MLNLANVISSCEKGFSTLIKTVLPRSLRLMVKHQVDAIKGKLVQQVKGLVGMSKAKAA